jgi:hypothetical protein
VERLWHSPGRSLSPIPTERRSEACERYNHAPPLRYDVTVAFFNAVGIEHTLARFFGKEIGDRLTFFDADVFRSGDPKDLAEIVRQVADTLEARIAFIRFPNPGQQGSPRAHVESCIDRLRHLANDMQQRTEGERENYHWEIFGALMAGIVGLLETLESNIPVQ